MSDAPATPEVVVPEATEEARTFTQEEVNRINAADRRADREKLAAFEAELAALREKATKLDAIEAENMTALDKANKERDDLASKLAEIEAQAKAAERKQLASDVAVSIAEELGVPAASALKVAPRLSGDTREAIEADAREVLGLLAPVAANVPAAIHDVQAAEPTVEETLKTAFLGK